MFSNKIMITTFLLTVLSLPALSNSASTTSLSSGQSKITLYDSEKSLTSTNWRLRKRVHILLEPTKIITQGNFGNAILFRMGRHFSLGPIFGFSHGYGLLGGRDIYGASSSNSNYNNEDYYNVTSERLTLGIKSVFYFKHVNLSSAYISAKVAASSVEVEADPHYGYGYGDAVYGSFLETEVGIMAGYQWHMRAITINLGGGLTHYEAPDKFEIYSANSEPYEGESYGSLTALNIDFGVGFSF